MTKPYMPAGKQLLDDLDLRLVSPPDGTGQVSVYCGNAGLAGAMSSAALWTGPGPASAAPDCDDPLLDASRNKVDNLENIIVREPTPGAGVRAGTGFAAIASAAGAGDADASVGAVASGPGDPGGT